MCNDNPLKGKKDNDGDSENKRAFFVCFKKTMEWNINPNSDETSSSSISKSDSVLKKEVEFWLPELINEWDLKSFFEADAASDEQL